MPQVGAVGDCCHGEVVVCVIGEGLNQYACLFVPFKCRSFRAVGSDHCSDEDGSLVAYAGFLLGTCDCDVSYADIVEDIAGRQVCGYEEVVAKVTRL